MSIVIGLPDEISDESAARIRDVLHELGDAFYRLGGAVETRYAGQIRRYYEPDCPPPLDDGQQLPLFPDLDPRSEAPARLRAQPWPAPIMVPPPLVPVP